VGSVVRQPESGLGGIVLSQPEDALAIGERWRDNLKLAATEENPEKRKRLMTIAVAGAGISGMETSAELAYAMRKEAEALGLNSSDTSVYLLNAKERLFVEGPEKVGKKIERLLSEGGVTVLHNCKAMGEAAGMVKLNNGDYLPAGLLVWTIGLIPNPVLRVMGLPLTPEGQVQVDECYRVKGAKGVYSIGDCAKIIDPKNNKVAKMRCAEGVMQAERLGKIVMADLEGRPAPVHKSLMDLFCIGLGENRGLVWARTWGLDIFITGKPAWKFKKLTWNHASKLR
jgi:NADH:ubiquinone reductase (H+-translocating)